MMASLSRSLSPRDRRALLWGGGIAAAAVMFAFGVKPYFRALRETRDELTTQRELLGRERAVLGAANKLPVALQQSRSTLANYSTPLFNGPDELSATSDLSDHISKAALGNRVLIQGLETRKAQSLNEGIVALAVDFRAESDFEGVLHFLNSVERGGKLVHVSSLVIQRQDRPVAPGVPDTEVLSVNGTVTGYGVFADAAEREKGEGGSGRGMPSRPSVAAPDTL
jgi:type II secretory pathway component PulM